MQPTQVSGLPAEAVPAVETRLLDACVVFPAPASKLTPSLLMPPANLHCSRSPCRSLCRPCTVIYNTLNGMTGWGAGKVREREDQWVVMWAMESGKYYPAIYDAKANGADINAGEQGGMLPAAGTRIRARLGFSSEQTQLWLTWKGSRCVRSLSHAGQARLLCCSAASAGAPADCDVRCSVVTCMRHDMCVCPPLCLACALCRLPAGRGGACPILHGVGAAQHQRNTRRICGQAQGAAGIV